LDEEAAVTSGAVRAAATRHSPRPVLYAGGDKAEDALHLALADDRAHVRVIKAAPQADRSDPRREQFDEAVMSRRLEQESSRRGARLRRVLHQSGGGGCGGPFQVGVGKDDVRRLAAE